MKFDELHCEPVGHGYEFRIYGEDGTYRPLTISVAAAWNLVEFVSNVERARRLAREEVLSAPKVKGAVSGSSDTGTKKETVP